MNLVRLSLDALVHLRECKERELAEKILFREQKGSQLKDRDAEWLDKLTHGGFPTHDHAGHFLVAAKELRTEFDSLGKEIEKIKLEIKELVDAISTKQPRD